VSSGHLLGRLGQFDLGVETRLRQADHSRFVSAGPGLAPGPPGREHLLEADLPSTHGLNCHHAGSEQAEALRGILVATSADLAQLGQVAVVAGGNSWLV
jgi:hypothetical protein